MSDGPPFGRTICACPADVAQCQRHPGYLIPRDLDRIAANLGAEPAELTGLLRANRHGLVVQGPLIRRAIGVTPAQDARGRCVFLTAEDRCAIHAVAPFGCAYLDVHMPPAERARRDAWADDQARASARFKAFHSQLADCQCARCTSAARARRNLLDAFGIVR